MWTKGGHPSYPGHPHLVYPHPMYGYGKGAPMWPPMAVPAAHHKEEQPGTTENHPPVPTNVHEEGGEAAKTYKDRTRTLAEWYSKPDHDGNFFIGDGEDDDHHRTTVDLSVAVRGLCMEYFEHHMSPLLRALQSTTEQQQQKLQELQTLVGQDLRETVAVEVARRNEQNTVSTLVRLQEISTALQKKADVNNVPSMLQWQALNAKIEKAGGTGSSGSTAPGAFNLEESQSQLNALETRLCSATTKAESNHQSLQQKVDALQQELQQLARPDEGGKQVKALDMNFGAELHKVKALVAAAGANFNKQIKDLKQQVKSLKEEAVQPVSLGSENLEERWPGRGVSNGPPSEAGSDLCSDVGSVTASLAGSVVAGMAPEEKAELRKMQVVVSAAATAFSKDIKEVRKHLREVQDDLSRLKGMAGL